MHETGLCEAIVEATLRRAAGRRVTGLRVRIGGHPVDPGVVDQGIRLAAAGTAAEHAIVELIFDPLWTHCRGCGHTAAVADHHALVGCPQCGGVDVDVDGSAGTVLESITVEDRRPQA